MRDRGKVATLKPLRVHRKVSASRPRHGQKVGRKVVKALKRKEKEREEKNRKRKKKGKCAVFKAGITRPTCLLVREGAARRHIGSACEALLFFGG